MMNKQSPMRALLWKDISVLMPLALGIAVFSVVIVLIAMSTMEDPRGMLVVSAVLFPNLVALGAPILLLGHEDETGTLNWQRTLPIDWRMIWLSKWLAVTMAILVACLGAAISIWILSLKFPATNLMLFGSIGSEWIEVYRSLSFTFMLLSVVVLVSWFLRGPAVALFTVVPVAVIAFVFAVVVANWCYDRYEEAWGSGVANLDSLFVGHVQWSLFAVMVGISAWVARARWLRSESPAGRMLRMFSFGRGDGSHPAYVPAPPVASAAPGIRRALLWQWLHQAKGFVGGIWIVAITATLAQFIYMYAVEDTRTSMFIGFMFLANGLLGVSVFIGDTTKERYRYLAQLGVSRWTVWWTRVLQPAAMMVVLSCLFLAGEWLLQERNSTNLDRIFDTPSEAVLFLIAMCVLPFVMGMISAMWARRAIVGALGHLVLTVLGIMCGVLTLEHYQEYLWAAVPAVLLLFVLTIRMQGRWLDGHRGQGYAWRFIGWLGLSAAVLIASIAVPRFWGTPAFDSQWRSATYALAQDVSPPESKASYVGHQMMLSLPVQGFDWRQGWDLQEQSQAALRDVIERVQAGEPIIALEVGGSITLERVLVGGFNAARNGEGGVLGSEHRFWYTGLMDLALSSRDNLLKTHGLMQSDQADSWELTLAHELSDPKSREYLGDETWNSYVARLRTRQQRSSDRREALLFSWGWANSSFNVDTQATSRMTFVAASETPLLTLKQSSVVDGRELAGAWGHAVTIGDYSAPAYRRRTSMLSIERARAWRYVDAATRVSLEQLGSGGLPSLNSVEDRQRANLWREGLDYSGDRPDMVWWDALPTRHWNREFEETIEGVRAGLEP